jgi:hypothetical protein
MSLRAWMIITLGHGDVGVPEEILDALNRYAGVQGMSGKRVAELM